MININPLPISGVVIGVLAVFFSYIEYRKSVFRKNDAVLWGLVWSSLIAISLISMFIVPLKQTIYIYSTLDLIIFLSFIGVYSLVFSVYRRQRIIDERTKVLVREMAYKRADEGDSTP